MLYLYQLQAGLPAFTWVIPSFLQVTSWITQFYQGNSISYMPHCPIYPIIHIFNIHRLIDFRHVKCIFGGPEGPVTTFKPPITLKNRPNMRKCIKKAQQSHHTQRSTNHAPRGQRAWPSISCYYSSIL